MTSFDTVAGQLRDRLLLEVFEQLPRLHLDAAALADHRRSALAATLAFAAEHSPWHAERLASVDLASVTPDDLSALPISTKTELMANWDRAVTDERLTRERATRHLAGLDASGPAFLDDEYLVFATGGSTGEPGVFPWSLDEYARWAASTIRFTADAGFPPPERMTFVGARSPRHPSALPPHVLYGLEPGRRHIVPVDQPVELVVAALNAADPDSMWVVSSMLPALVSAKESGSLHITPAAISVGGDCVDAAALDAAEKAFGVRPMQTYPTTDLGHLATAAPGEEPMTLNDDLFVVEVVDDEDRPVAVGELGHHLLVTSLHQRTLPMIRYRLDDRVRLERTSGRYAAYGRIAEVDGRADDLFRYDNVTVHPHVFRSVISAHPAVADHQVRQTDRGARVSVVTHGSFESSGLRHDLQLALERAGLSDPDVTVEKVDLIPRSPVGKRLHFVTR